jgi:hypothetical protein
MVILSILFVLFTAAGCPDNFDLDRIDGRTVEDGAAPSDSLEQPEDPDAETSDAVWSGDGPPPEDMACADTPPALVPSAPCGAYEDNLGDICASSSAGNLSLRFATSTPCMAEVVCQEGPDSPATFEEVGECISLEHHLVLWDLPGGATLLCDLFCHCPYGQNVTVLKPSLEVPIKKDLGVRITEVFANPAGPEPAQEYVEIASATASVVDLGGWRIGDAPPPECQDAHTCSLLLEGYGDAIPGGTVISRDQVLLLVPSTYDPTDPHDVMVPPGCTLVRLDDSLGERGLRNDDGEPVFLVSPEGDVATFYPNTIGTTPEGVSVERTHLRHPDGDPGTWMKNPGQKSTPCLW